MKPNWIIDLAKKADSSIEPLSSEDLETIFEEMYDPDDFVKACYNGDWMYFLEDNPGVKEAIMDWLSEYWGSGRAALSPEHTDALRDLGMSEGWIEAPKSGPGSENPPSKVACSFCDAKTGASEYMEDGVPQYACKSCAKEQGFEGKESGK